MTIFPKNSFSNLFNSIINLKNKVFGTKDLECRCFCDKIMKGDFLIKEDGVVLNLCDIDELDLLEEETKMDEKVVNQVHVVHSKEEKKWKIKRAGVDEEIESHKLKVDAVKSARAISKKSKSELVIHNMDDKIAIKDSHGNDPRSVKG